jgi:hypothetical protein
MMIIRFVIGLFVVIVMSLHGKLMHNPVRPRCVSSQALRGDCMKNHCGVATGEA